MSKSTDKSNNNKQTNKDSSCEKISLEEYNNQSTEYTKKMLEELNQQLKESKFNKTKFNRKDANNNSNGIQNMQQNTISLTNNIQNESITENYSENCSSSSDDDNTNNTDDNDTNNDSNHININRINTRNINTNGKNTKKMSVVNKNINNKKRKLELNEDLISSLLSKYENEHNQVLNLNANYIQLQKDYNKLEKKNHFLTLDLSNQKVSNDNLNSKLKDLMTKYDSEIQYNNIKTNCYHKEIDTYITIIKNYKFKIKFICLLFLLSTFINIYYFITTVNN
tara:strand:- start:227 stop:1069 length:843 start_codon:yes stop_codon:yes gene_type:complete